MLENFSTARMFELAAFGFKPGVVISSNEPNFGFADLRDALFESTYSNPKTIPVRIDKVDTLNVLVDSVRAVYVPDDVVRLPSRAIAYHDNPDWYVEGRIRSYTQAVRLYVIASTLHDVDEVYIQLISDSASTEAAGLIYHACAEQLDRFPFLTP